MTEHEERLYDIAFGLHSRIPGCCVRFFVDEWSRFRMWKNEESAYLRAVEFARFGYVPCPECLAKGRKVNLRICIVECGREHREDFMPEVEDAHESDGIEDGRG